jgi:hypothetical protein
MSESKPDRRGWSVLQICVTVLGVMFLIGIIIPVQPSWQDKAMQAATMGNARQIVTALLIYAQDHKGRYPDADLPGASSSNEVFRRLIQEEILEEERIFGAKVSKYVPDNNIGVRSEYAQALEVGENHWAMTAGVTKESSQLTPMVFETPAVASWPPLWNADAASKTVKGRTWPKAKIIVGFHDLSVQAIQLNPKTGPAVGPERGADGKDIFTRAKPSMTVLDILE